MTATPTPIVARGPVLGVVLVLGLVVAGCQSGSPPISSPPEETSSESSPAAELTPADPTPAGSAEPSPPPADALPSPAPPPPASLPEPRPTTPAVPGSSSDTELTIDVTDASGAVTTYTLVCDPPGGSHPDPTAACAALAEVLASPGDDPFRPTPPDTICTQQFGGPETASIAGRLDGRDVRASLSLRDGCEIDRWTRLGGLLSPFADPAAGTGITG